MHDCIGVARVLLQLFDSPGGRHTQPRDRTNTAANTRTPQLASANPRRFPYVIILGATGNTGSVVASTIAFAWQTRNRSGSRFSARRKVGGRRALKWLPLPLEDTHAVGEGVGRRGRRIPFDFAEFQDGGCSWIRVTGSAKRYRRRSESQRHTSRGSAFFDGCTAGAWYRTDPLPAPRRDPCLGRLLRT